MGVACSTTRLIDRSNDLMPVHEFPLSQHYFLPVRLDGCSQMVVFARDLGRLSSRWTYIRRQWMSPSLGVSTWFFQTIPWPNLRNDADCCFFGFLYLIWKYANRVVVVISFDEPVLKHHSPPEQFIQRIY